ncbi:MAG: mannose-1-phosphate guanylyltransferase/mannose-6-phosphate isomerase [Planktomarina sp.]
MITPVILAGGSGTRLWPLSRRSFPKQFHSIGTAPTLFQRAALRTKGFGFSDPLVITGEDFRFLVADQLADVDCTAALTLIEPVARDTAPAILAAALALVADDPGAVLLIAPSDHHVSDTAAFQAIIHAARPTADAGHIVTFGITPDRPETGYGYLELADTTPSPTPVPLIRFVEKPEQSQADLLATSGKHLWNAGIFLARADILIAAFNAHAADMVPPVQQAIDDAQDDLEFTRLAPAPWNTLRSQSVDYAIMEHLADLYVQRFAGDWSDLGSWDAIWRMGPPGTDGVTTMGGAYDVGSDNSLLYRSDDAPAVVSMGLSDTIVVATKDAVLVADRSQAQNVKQAVAELTRIGEDRAQQTDRMYRPWGWYETLALGSRFQVKRIVVKPSGILSLQSHTHRSEHWVVVEGVAHVTIGDQINAVAENQSVYIPAGTTHRMENRTDTPMVLIEVQTGSYLGEDDIVRYDDAYNRD